MLEHLKYKVARAVESHPYLWFAAWTVAHKLTFLLPHDRSYFAIRHFGGTSNHLLVDVGANDGISALSFHKLEPDVRILSLEPNPLHRSSLQALKTRIPNFDFMMVGAGDAAAEIRLFSPYYKGIALHTFTSGSVEQVKTAVAKSFGPNVAAALEVTECAVPVIALDELNLAPWTIKIDVEGFDYKVLLGARGTLERHRPYVIVEACHAELEPMLGYFAEFNYVVLTFDQAINKFAHLEQGTLEYATGARNLFAVPHETLATLPMKQTTGHIDSDR
jgi:FkbM family methyltransferase